MIVKGEFFVAEKENASRLRAADFARICGTNKRTLHHYDQIGLFAPALRGENGYRYYSQEQYDVFMVIAALKELGMPLLDIKAYLDRRDPERLSALLVQQGGGGAGAGPAPADPAHNPHQAEAAGAGAAGGVRPGVL